ncbi:MAG: hypothetical protein H7Z40_11505 [Phycisphaerae bacterium]|nr:hypothetical protein [Gemmatimonadaceae bacterium]
MPHYLISGILPDNFDPSAMTEEMIGEIHGMNAEMDALNMRLFAGGLEPASMAKTVRVQGNGEVIVTDGPYVEAKEHIGGLSVVECANLDEALKWARRAAVACRTPVEVRGIFYVPRPGLEE